MSSTDDQAREVLALLRDHHNVLISGPPATGKTLLLSAIERLFQGSPTSPPHVKGAAVPIPKGSIAASSPWLPSPASTKRAIFRTVFHQNSKYRDFVSGLMPDLTSPGKFTVSEGTLLKANDHASAAGCASLLIIDELNRGPAVQLFGGAIVAMEDDKRGDALGAPRFGAVGFDALRTTGTEEVYLSDELYIVGVMNQADTSVEALDVAFLRRWEGYKLAPSAQILMAYLGVASLDSAPPDTASSASDVYAAAIRAWAAVNGRISVGRGTEYQMGHGVFMAEAAATTTAEAAEHVARSWTKVLAHVDEIFFGDARGTAAVLNLLTVPNPVATFETVMFGDEPRERVISPSPVPSGVIYGYLLAVADDGST